MSRVTRVRSRAVQPAGQRAARLRRGAAPAPMRAAGCAVCEARGPPLSLLLTAYLPITSYSLSYHFLGK